MSQKQIVFFFRTKHLTLQTTVRKKAVQTMWHTRKVSNKVYIRELY